VNQVGGTSVEIDVGLNRGGFRDERIVTEATVQAPGEVDDGVKHAELDKRP